MQGFMQLAQSQGHRIGIIPVSSPMKQQLEQLGFDSCTSARNRFSLPNPIALNWEPLSFAGLGWLP
jgi:hypothetical protein